MKRSMPRLIHDTRVKRMRWIAAGLAVAMALTTVGYNSWMRPYRLRRTEIESVIREGESFAEKIRDDVGSEAERRLEAAWKKLRELDTKECQIDKTDKLEIDPYLYIPEDRNKAKTLDAEYKSASAMRNQAANEVATAVRNATALTADIRRLMGNKKNDNVINVCSDIAQCLGELSVLHKQPRPRAEPVAEAMERYHAAYVKALSVRDNYMEWIENTNEAIDKSQKCTAGIISAMNRLQDGQRRMETIRKAAGTLRIDRNGGRLEAMRREIANAAKELEKREKELADAARAAEGMRTERLEKARRHCMEVAERAAALAGAHGTLLPHEAVAAARKAPEAFDALAKEEETVWKSRRTLVAKSFSLAKDLREECAKSIQTIDGIIKTGTGISDCARISGLPDRARAVEKELSDALSSLSLDGLNASLDAIVEQAKKDLSAVEAGKPDIPALARSIRDAAKNVRDSLNSAEASLAKLGTTVEDGSGAARDNLLKIVADCSNTFNAMQSDLQTIERASAANGKEVLGLEKRLENARGGTKELEAKIAGLPAKIKTAVEAGQFALVSWAPGALGRTTNSSLTKKTIMTGDVLVAPEGTGSPAYKWEFALAIGKSGKHQIEVRVAPSARNGIYNLNTAMPDRTYSVETKRNRAKGGWIRTELSLSNGKRKWTGSKPLANRTRMETPEAVVLSANGEFGKGSHAFQLDIGLSIDTSLMDEKQKAGLPDVSQGWRLEGLAVRIYLDGEQVHQFWHKTSATTSP